MAGVVIPIQTTDAGREQVRQNLENLGSQMSALVQSYNDLRGKLEGENKAELREKMKALMEQRRQAILALVDSFKAAKASAETQGIATTAAVPALAGLRGDDLSGIQTAVATEQSKLAALAAYYEEAKAAVAAGQAVPPVPESLTGSSTIAGIPTLWLLVGAAVVLFMFTKK